MCSAQQRGCAYAISASKMVKGSRDLDERSAESSFPVPASVSHTLSQCSCASKKLRLCDSMRDLRQANHCSIQVSRVQYRLLAVTYPPKIEQVSCDFHCLMTVPSRRRISPHPPFKRVIFEWRFRGFLFVNLNAPSRLFAYPQIAVAHFRASLEDGLRSLIEWRILLNAEVITHQVESYICHVSRLVKHRPGHAKPF